MRHASFALLLYPVVTLSNITWYCAHHWIWTHNRRPMSRAYRASHGVSLLNWVGERYPEGKVHGANMGPTWVLSALDGPHVGPINLVIRVERLGMPGFFVVAGFISSYKSLDNNRWQDGTMWYYLMMMVWAESCGVQLWSRLHVYIMTLYLIFCLIWYRYGMAWWLIVYIMSLGHRCNIPCKARVWYCMILRI